MRVFMALKATPKTETGIFDAADAARMKEMGDLIEDMAKAGVLIAAEGLKPSSAGVRVKYENGKRTITDGPFAEAKEIIGGFVIFEVASMDEALVWSERFAAVEGDYECEIRPLYEVTDFAADVFSPEDAAREQALREELQRKAGAARA